LVATAQVAADSSLFSRKKLSEDLREEDPGPHPP
jgi:hypothetical protein